MGNGNARPRRRHRSVAESMYWEKLTVDQKVAFTNGYAVGQGADFPTPAMIADLRQQIARPGSPRQRTPRRLASDPTTPGESRQHVGRYDYAEVARIARQAIAEGRSAAQALVDRLGSPSTAAASMAISSARKAGHDIPYVRGAS